MDTNKLRTLVFEKTGIRIDAGDPVFALVALNEAVLAECVEPHVEALRQAADILRDQTAQLTAAGASYQNVLQQVALLGQGEKAPQVAMALAIESAGSSATAQPTGKPTGAQLLIGAVGIAVLSAALTLAGGSVLRKDPEPPAIPVKIAEPAVPALTHAQLAMIENGEKFEKMWPKLDAATQAKIKRILQQP